MHGEECVFSWARGNRGNGSALACLKWRIDDSEGRGVWISFILASRRFPRVAPAGAACVRLGWALRAPAGNGERVLAGGLPACCVAGRRPAASAEGRLTGEAACWGALRGREGWLASGARSD